MYRHRIVFPTPNCLRTSCQRSTACLAGSGGDGIGAAGLRAGDAAAPEEGLQLSPGYVARWRELRGELERRRESRRKQRRFRHDPDAYLADPEK